MHSGMPVEEKMRLIGHAHSIQHGQHGKHLQIERLLQIWGWHSVYPPNPIPIKSLQFSTNHILILLDWKMRDHAPYDSRKGKHGEAGVANAG
jgi:hypothetical protein